MIHLVGLVQGWDQLVSACLGIGAAAVAALGPKLVKLVGAWIERLEPAGAPGGADGPPPVEAPMVGPPEPTPQKEQRSRGRPDLPPPPSAEV